jgi:hypothetical protein
MNRHLPCSTLLALVLVTASTSDAGAQPLGVFVTFDNAPGGGTPSEADRLAASAAYDAANTARKDLEKTLKAQFGNKRDKWPVEAQERLLDAEDAVAQANADWLYRRDAEPVNDEWREYIAKALTQSGRTGKKEHVTSVSAAKSAYLILTITGVRNPLAAINGAADRCVAVRLERGIWTSAAQFSRVPRTYRPRRSKALRLATPNHDSAAWRFEACGSDPYFDAEEAVANVVNDFAGAHRAVLTAQPE